MTSGIRCGCSATLDRDSESPFPGWGLEARWPLLLLAGGGAITGVDLSRPLSRASREAILAAFRDRPSAALARRAGQTADTSGLMLGPPSARSRWVLRARGREKLQTR